MERTRDLLGARIKELRKLGRLSQEKLAEMIDIDPKYLSKIEVGRSFPSMDTLTAIAKSLKMDLKDFFDFEHQKESSQNITKAICSLLKEAGEDKQRLILKVVRAIIR